MHEPLTSKEIEIELNTPGRGFTEITAQIEHWIDQIGAVGGLLTIFIRHTSASLTIQENADPSVLHDLERALAILAPEDRHYQHAQEGPDDMPAHIKSVLTSTSLSVPIINQKTALGTWQGIYFCEFDGPRNRRVTIKVLSD